MFEMNEHSFVYYNYFFYTIAYKYNNKNEQSLSSKMAHPTSNVNVNNDNNVHSNVNYQCCLDHG